MMQCLNVIHSKPTLFLHMYWYTYTDNTSLIDMHNYVSAHSALLVTGRGGGGGGGGGGIFEKIIYTNIYNFGL